MKVKIWLPTFLLGVLSLSGCTSDTVHAQSISLPKSALSRASIDSILPNGTTPAETTVINDESNAYIVVATPGTLAVTDPGWIVVGQWDKKELKWDLEWIHQGLGGQITQLVKGPSDGGTDTIAALYHNGADTGSETIAILGITSKSVNILRNVPYVLNGKVSVQKEKYLITGGNYQETDQWSNGKWTFKKLTVKQLLNQADVHVMYVDQNYYNNSGTYVHSTKIIGPTTIHVKVGQTVSFIPADNQTWSDLGGTSIYTNDGGNGAFGFAQVNMIRGNVVPMDTAGAYKFAIVSSKNMALQANSTTAVVTIVVTQ